MPGLGLALFAAAPEGAGGGGPRRLPPRPPELIAGLGDRGGTGRGRGRREVRGLKLGFPPLLGS